MNIMRVLSRIGWAGVLAGALGGWGEGEEKQSPRTMNVDLGEGVTLELVWIEPGRFVRGSPLREVGRKEDETPHGVILSQGFWLGRHEITQAEWVQVMGDNPAFFEGSNRPVESVSWEDAQLFIQKLNERAGGGFRLPTEAEWEYACRAGMTNAMGRDLSTLAWYRETSEGATRPVGEKGPNAWGLMDMLGNVAEWCQDWYGPYPRGTVHDPTGPASGHRRVVRGGSWLSDERQCRAAARQAEFPDTRENSIGFRVARDPEAGRF